MTLPTITIHPRKALPFFSRHPWVFAGAIAGITGDPAPGAEVDVVAHDGKWIARGLFNPHSQIRVRLYSWTPEEALDRAFWQQRLATAAGLREELFPTLRQGAPSLACRWVASEGDQLSGLTVDRYGDWLLVQLTSLALAQRQEMLIELLRERFSPQGIWLRTEKGIRAAEGLDQQDGLLWGAPPPRPQFIEENGIKYGVDVTEGQKTGFFLDQRENRRFIGERLPLAGKRVLDLCCYSGGFALNAAVRGGAREVIGVDVSEPALELARANAALNGIGAQLRFQKQDSFQALEQFAAQGETFDAIVLDPPKMTRNKAGLDAALRGYFSLNKLAIERLNPGGWLVTCSCSGRVTHEMFTEVLARASVHARRPLQIIEARGPSGDHPTSAHCPESDYLKCYVCRVA